SLHCSSLRCGNYLRYRWCSSSFCDGSRHGKCGESR
ncbi:Histidinol dehydrogenase, partial [Haemophilus influenzae]